MAKIHEWLHVWLLIKDLQAWAAELVQWALDLSSSENIYKTR